jgi:hypothetical protein
MRKMRACLLVSCALAVSVPAAEAGAADPLATVQADVAKITSDVAAAHDTVAADRAAIAADVQAASAAGTSRPTSSVKADLKKLMADIKSARRTIATDQRTFRLDARDAHKANVDKVQLRSLLLAVRTQLKLFHTDMAAALRQTGQALRGAKPDQGVRPAFRGPGAHK